ncbi:tRNA (adenosine(37)-N6)-threonylcarbamoyltransferase complex ATPase subunit type 1 TsaE [Jannaschia sp. R86511]|uniref:tRNA (adenosine(37)-N6)-threonylcarbamoyltransferase complex ATPase subunit type 1 TsaE n=1 Tax=Jannaschia sp. R86511 TaxID=3093853 RepID=UPI0036D350DA
MPEAATTRVLCPSAAATRRLGQALGHELVGGDVVVLTGDLGAGKTTFVQGLARGLGVTAPVTSPTFVLARHQRTDPAGPRPDGPDLVHVDAYRLAGALELDDLDLDSDLDHAVVVVEWGHGLAERLSPRRVEVTIDRDGTPSDGAAGPGDGAGDGVGDGVGDGTGDEPRRITVVVVGDHPRLGPGALLVAARRADPEHTDLEAPC